MIGNAEIPNRTVLAPMAVTNSLSVLFKELGATRKWLLVATNPIQRKDFHMLYIDEGETQFYPTIW